MISQRPASTMLRPACSCFLSHTTLVEFMVYWTCGIRFRESGHGPNLTSTHTFLNNFSMQARIPKIITFGGKLQSVGPLVILLCCFLRTLQICSVIMSNHYRSFNQMNILDLQISNERTHQEEVKLFLPF